MKKLISKNITRTIIITFIQGFLGSLAVTVVKADLSNKSIVISLIFGASISGISACFEIFKNKRKLKNVKKSNFKDR